MVRRLEFRLEIPLEELLERLEVLGLVIDQWEIEKVCETELMMRLETLATMAVSRETVMYCSPVR